MSDPQVPAKVWNPSARVEVATLLALAIVCGISLVKAAGSMPEHPSGSPTSMPIPGSPEYTVLLSPVPLP